MDDFEIEAKNKTIFLIYTGIIILISALVYHIKYNIKNTKDTEITLFELIQMKY